MNPYWAILAVSVPLLIFCPWLSGSFHNLHTIRPALSEKEGEDV